MPILVFLCFDRFLWLNVFFSISCAHLQIHNLRPFLKRYFHNSAKAFFSCANSSGFVFSAMLGQRNCDLLEMFSTVKMTFFYLEWPRVLCGDLTMCCCL